MAASTFLGLAYTFSTGAHIRVNLLIGRLGPAGRRLIEIWCCPPAAAVGLALFSANAWSDDLRFLVFKDTQPWPDGRAVLDPADRPGARPGHLHDRAGRRALSRCCLPARFPSSLDAEAQAIGDGADWPSPAPARRKPAMSGELALAVTVLGHAVLPAGERRVDRHHAADHRLRRAVLLYARADPARCSPSRSGIRAGAGR